MTYDTEGTFDTKPIKYKKNKWFASNDDCNSGTVIAMWGEEGQPL